MAIRILLSSRLGERRLTRKDLAQATGISPNTIGDMYNEFIERVSLEQLDRICEVLGCDISEILKWEPNKMPLRERLPELFNKPGKE